MKYFVQYVLSRIPIFCISDDSNFHNIDKRGIHFNDLRYSLISFGLGDHKIYFLSWKRKDGFSFFKKIYLATLLDIPNQTTLSEKAENYYSHLTSVEDDNVRNEAEFLKYKISDEANRISSAYTKANIYTGIVLGVFPIILSIGINQLSSLKEFYYIIIILSLLYCLINATILLFNFYKVRSSIRSTFGKMKEAKDALREKARAYYLDWFSIKSNAPLYVSYIANIERYIRLSFIILVILIVLANIPKIGFNISNVGQNNLYSFHNILIEKMSKTELNQLLEIENKLVNKFKVDVIILSPYNFNVTSMLNILNKYNLNNSRIRIINDKQLHQDIKIIVLE